MTARLSVVVRAFDETPSLGGVGRGVVGGANSVVTRSVLDRTSVAGNPARYVAR